MLKHTSTLSKNNISYEVKLIALRYLPQKDSYGIIQAIQQLESRSIDKSGKKLVSRPSNSPLLKHEIDFFLKIIHYINTHHGTTAVNDTYLITTILQNMHDAPTITPQDNSPPAPPKPPSVPYISPNLEPLLPASLPGSMRNTPLSPRPSPISSTLGSTTIWSFRESSRSPQRKKQRMQNLTPQ